MKPEGGTESLTGWVYLRNSGECLIIVVSYLLKHSLSSFYCRECKEPSTFCKDIVINQGVFSPCLSVASSDICCPASFSRFIQLKCKILLFLKTFDLHKYLWHHPEQLLSNQMLWRMRTSLPFKTTCTWCPSGYHDRFVYFKIVSLVGLLVTWNRRFAF